MQDQPSPDAILAAVAAWLRDTAADALPAHARFEAKVARLARSCIFGLLREHVENKRLIDGQT